MAESQELTISDIRGSVTKSGPDVYVDFRLGDRSASTGVIKHAEEKVFVFHYFFHASISGVCIVVHPKLKCPNRIPQDRVLGRAVAAASARSACSCAQQCGLSEHLLPFSHLVLTARCRISHACSCTVLSTEHLTCCCAQIEFTEPVMIAANDGGRGSQAKSADELVVGLSFDFHFPFIFLPLTTVASYVSCMAPP